MSRRPLALLSITLASLTLAACSDVTAPTPSSQRQITPAGAPSADLCEGGYTTSTGKC